MRTLEQCRDEIFLRSRQRIQRRKKIRWAVGTACLSLALVAVLLLPGSTKGTEASLAEAAPDGAPPISALGSVTVTVELPGRGGTIHADPILGTQLEGFFLKEEGIPEPPKEAPESAPVTGGIYGENYSPSPIRITCRDGEQELHYLLQGNKLSCEELGETVTLSHEEKSRLEAYWTAN